MTSEENFANSAPQPASVWKSVDPARFCTGVGSDLSKVALQPELQHLGLGVRALHDLDELIPENLSKRIVLFTYGTQAKHGSDGKHSLFHRIRASLYNLCDSHLRPYCAATQRPYPLRERLDAAQFPEASQHQPRKVSLAVVDVGALCPSSSEDSALTAAGLSGPSVHEMMARVLACKPALVIVCSDSCAPLETIYGAHALAAAASVLPLIMFSSRMSFSQASSDDRRAHGLRMLHDYGAQLLNGRAMLQLGIQRERNTQSDYELALKHGVWIIEYLYLMGCWRNALNGREVSALEHVHDHLDKILPLGWSKSEHGLQVAFSLDVLSDQWNIGISNASPFGCSLQELGSVLTYLGRTGLCRVLHIMGATDSDSGAGRAAEIIATLIYKLIVLREEYSEC